MPISRLQEEHKDWDARGPELSEWMEQNGVRVDRAHPGVAGERESCGRSQKERQTMKPPTRTWRGELFICDRCDSLSFDCPVCRAAIIRNPIRVQAIEGKRGYLYHLQCRLVRWLWSPAGRQVNHAADLFIRLSGLAMAMSLAMCLVITVGRFLISFPN